MSALGGWVQRYLTKLLLGMLAGGFAILLAELVLTAHVDGIQLVAVVASVAGLILTVAAMFVSGRAGITVAALLLVLSVTGLLGAYQHYEARTEDSEREAAVPAYGVGTPANQVVTLRAQDDDDRPARGEEGPEGAPPPLAPLSLSGLSLMAAIVTVGASKPRA